MKVCGILLVTLFSATEGAIQGNSEENFAFWTRYLQSETSMFPTPTPQNGPFPTPTSSPIFPTPPSPEIPTLPPSPFEPTITPQPSELPCGIPSQLRAELLTNIAEETSGPITIGSPQDRALQWLITEDGFIVCPDDPKALQRYILALVYYSTNGDSKFHFHALL